MPPGATADIELLTRETMEIFKKAQTTGLYASTGIQGVDLSGLVSLVPVNVPARNNTSAFPRVIAGEGSQTATWRSLLNVNSSQTDAAVGIDYAGSLTILDEQDCFATYKVLAKANRVTLDAVAFARNYADALAVAELQTLNQLFIAQDLYIINGQNWALGTPGGPLTLTSGATGGAITTGTVVYVAVSAKSGANYFVSNGNSPALVGHTTVGTTSSTNTVTASIPAVKGAVAYDWYVGTSAAQYYYTTTTIAQATFTLVPTAAQAAPTTLPLFTTLATPPATAPTADTSYNAANWYNGIIASTLGDYGTLGPVTPGTGTATGATFIDNGGNAPNLSGGGIDILDTINDKIWASVQLSPTAYMMNSLQGDEISKAILSSSSATTFLPPTDADARTNLAGGGYIGRYINRAAGGVPVAIEIHPRMAPGTIFARCDRVPFPGSNIGSVFEVRCQYDTMRFDYAANLSTGTLGGGPRYDFEIRSNEVLVNRGPVAQAVATNIA